MATSESDDFESADEEMNHDISARRNNQTQIWSSPTAIDSESDDDTEFVPRTPYNYKNIAYSEESKKCSSKTDLTENKNTIDKVAITSNEDDNIKNACNNEKGGQLVNNRERTDNEFTLPNLQTEKCVRDSIDLNTMTLNVERNDEGNSVDEITARGSTIKNSQVNTNNITTNICKENVLTDEKPDAPTISLVQDELSELEMPEEMKSDKTFKEVFKPEGWEGLGSEIELPEELTEEKLQPILKKLSLAGQEVQTSYTGWGWDNWAVSSLINTATVGVSAITSQVSHGLTLLEETIAETEDPNINETDNEEISVVDADKTEEQCQQYSFGFGNFLSGVSSITKLVESTGSKVMSGGLDTLEAIGKKTMEVLQEGDPGLKKKRAIFINEAEKPNLSQVLREAKEKADTTEKTNEEKQKMRKVHFESLFDDYQGLVHLEALEMLSKQCNIKIQQHLIGLNTTELTSAQETLQDVQELCNVGDDDDNEKEGDINDLKFRLQEISNDLGVNITYEKLHSVCEESEVYLAPPIMHAKDEIFEKSISVLAQFTAFSVERFHKTAEVLLIKEHRSTVNEADALVQLTRVLCNQIGILANAHCNSLHTPSKIKETPDSIKTDITTIFMEASNASSYIQDAFKLLIPIIQVGTI